MQDDTLGPLMGGLALPLPFDTIKAGLDATYDGMKNILVGVADETTNTLGGAYFIHQEYQHRRAEVHHVFLERYRGKFCLEAYHKVIDYMKNQLRLEIIYGHFAASNQHPSKYLEKLGWKKAGILPKYYITSHGQEDAHVFYLELN
jgi:RimJ/RimL family protein N-acetyltransferase